MKKKDTIAINTHYINSKIKELGLKRSWLAKKVGVDKRTISRWTTGKVKRIAINNAKALADCLQATVEELSDQNDIYVLGTQLDKELAASAIISENLLLLLSPTGNWGLIENIIKSTISPSLSKYNTGRLYNWLSITQWRMGSYENARSYAKKALLIGKEVDEKSIIVKALFNLGTIDSLCGENDSALDSYLKCYEFKEFFETKGDLASLYTNLSMVYRDIADFSKSLHYQYEAIELFSAENKSYNLAIAFQCLGYIYTEIGEFNKAIESMDVSSKHAQKSNYQAGLVTIPLYKLDALALSKKYNLIDDNIITCIDKFLSGKNKDPFCFEYIARYYRLISNINIAKEIIEKGLEESYHNPVANASLLHERARLALWQNDLESEQLYREKGNEIYISIGLIKRIINKEIPEYGDVFSN